MASSSSSARPAAAAALEAPAPAEAAKVGEQVLVPQPPEGPPPARCPARAGHRRGEATVGQQRRALKGLLPGLTEYYTAPASIERALLAGETRLLRVDWLLKFFQQRSASGTPAASVLPRRQDLPDEAFWKTSDLFAQDGALTKKVISVSHCWLTPEHPDPEGRVLQMLVRVFAQLILYEGPGAVFWDWCSLFQEPRTPEEEEAHSRSAPFAGVWFGHKKVWKMLVTAAPEGCNNAPRYDEVGRTFFERNVAHLLSPAEMVFDLARIGEGFKDYTQIVEGCSMHEKSPPLANKLFAQELLRKQFANSADRQTLTRVYHEVFMAWMSSDSLDYSNQSWGDAEVALFIPALRLCSRLRQLDLSNNDLGDPSAEKIAGALPRCRCLQRLVLTNCSVTLKGEMLLREAWNKTGRVPHELEMGGLAEMPTTSSAEEAFFYEGEFRKRQRYGQGVLTSPGTGFKYVGSFAWDQFSGEGDATWGDGSRYQGQWRDGQKNGHGEYVSADGLRYVGEWEKGQRNGEGTQEFKDGGKYDGTWQNGVCSGKGTYWFSDGSRFEGSWTKGHYNGTGVMYASDGSRERQSYRAGVLVKYEVLTEGFLPNIMWRNNAAIPVAQVREDILKPAVLPKLLPSKHAIRRDYGESNLSAPPLKAPPLVARKVLDVTMMS